MKYGELQRRLREVLFATFEDYVDEVDKGMIYSAAAEVCDFLVGEWDGQIEWENPEPGVLHHTDERMIDPRLITT